MLARVLMDHHAPHRPAGTTQPVRSAPLRRRDDPGSGQRHPSPGVAPLHPVKAPGVLVEVADAEPLVAVAIQPADLLNLLVRCAPGRHTTDPAIPEPLQPLVRIAAPQPKKMPLAAPQNPSRFLTAQPVLRNVLVNL